MEQRRSRSGASASRVAVLLVVLAAVFVSLSGAAGATPVAVDVGRLAGPSGVLRDGGWSVPVGGRLLWLFGDTLYPGCDPVCASNSAGLGGASGPTDELGAEFIPLTAEERSAWHAGNDRVAVWPSGAVPTGPGTAAVFFARYHVVGPVSYVALGWGVATVSVGDATATRVLEMPGRPFGHPLLVGRRVYAYSCERTEGIASACKVARAVLGRVAESDGWRYWNGARWSQRPKRATFVLSGPLGGLSVSWNAHLGRYLAVYNVPLSNRVAMRTAQSPTGPWSAPTTLFTGLDAPAGTFDYAGMEHPELAAERGRVITVTYYHPLGTWQGEIRRVEVTLA